MKTEQTSVLDRPEEALSLDQFLASMKMGPVQEGALEPVISDNFSKINEKVSPQARFVSSLAALIGNIEQGEGFFDRGKIQELIARTNKMVNDQVNEIIHHPKFQKLESTWRGLFNLLEKTNFRANIMIDILDVSKEELEKDFFDNSIDFTGSAFFKKVYVAEYDQYGGKPYGAIIGLYEFQHTPADLKWLRMMGKVANASHAPFISSVSPQFFGCETIEELAGIKDLEGLMNHPSYSAFNALRESEEAAYIGLCLPAYVARLPWHPVKNPSGNFNFVEYTWGDDHKKYLWGNPAILFAQNLARSFETSGWCQYLRGPKGGGLVTGLPVHTFNLRGEEEIKLPVEMAIPDSRELDFANSGFIPLIYRKGTGEACFFSAQSLKRPKKLRDPKDAENAQMVCNLPYTFSITRMAHYVKCIARDNIGSSANAEYMQDMLNRWISEYVTKTVNPDILTLRRYPFKTASVTVKEKPGKIGWYDCSISVLPHLQMEGLDVVLTCESRLG